MATFICLSSQIQSWNGESGISPSMSEVWLWWLAFSPPHFILEVELSPSRLLLKLWSHGPRVRWQKINNACCSPFHGYWLAWQSEIEVRKRFTMLVYSPRKRQWPERCDHKHPCMTELLICRLDSPQTPYLWNGSVLHTLFRRSVDILLEAIGKKLFKTSSFVEGFHGCTGCSKSPDKICKGFI